MSGLSRQLEAHFQNPRGLGRATAPALRGKSANPACGDLLEVEIVIREGRVAEARFMAQACSSVIAVASLTMEAIEGADAATACALDIRQLVENAGGLHSGRRHAIQMMQRALSEIFSKI